MPSDGFAPPASQLGQTGLGAPIPNTVEPAGGMGLTLDPEGRIPPSVNRVRVITSLSSAPAEKYDGNQLLVRVAALPAGTTAYETVLLTHDATIGKWISDPLGGHVMHTDAADTLATSSTVYVQTASSQVLRFPIPNAKALYDAGLRLQIWMAGRLDNTGANTSTAQVQIYEFSDGDTTLTAGLSGPEIANTGTTQTYDVSGWTTATGTPGADNHWIGVCQIKTSADTALFEDLMARFRWISS